MCASPAVVSLYVSPENGNDRYSGSEQYPFATLEKAVRTAQLLEEKTMIYLREGVYPGGLLLDQSAEHYLSIEDAVTVGSLILHKLLP